jgi:hypothetical protein
VLCLPDGEDMILIASNFGRPRNPAWYQNLRADPSATIVFEGTSREVAAREVVGAERERDYRRGLPRLHPLPPLGGEPPNPSAQARASELSQRRNWQAQRTGSMRRSLSKAFPANP